MEADPFAWIVQLCRPTASPANLPMARSPEFADSDSTEQMSGFVFLDSDSDSDPTPTEATEIYMVSLSESSDSVHQRAVFHTPPEHHPRSHLSSSEDQNVDEGAVVGPDKRKEVGAASEAGPEAKKQRGMEDEETVPVGETEVIVDDTEIIVDLGEEESFKTNGKRIEVVNLGEEESIKTNGVVNMGEEESIKANGKRIEGMGRRRLPESLKGRGKGKEKEDEETKCGLLEVFDVLKVVYAKPEDGSKDGKNEGYIAMFQKKGLTFSKPRWW